MTEHELQDPGDSEFYFRMNGWNRVKIKQTNSDCWFKKITENETTLEILVEMTLGGRRKFYVEDPPEAFRAAAHDGDCLTSYGLADGENTFRVHFNRRPETIADGINTLREMLQEKK